MSLLLSLSGHLPGQGHPKKGCWGAPCTGLNSEPLHGGQQELPEDPALQTRQQLLGELPDLHTSRN